MTSILKFMGLEQLNTFFPTLCYNRPIIDEVCLVFGFQIDCVSNFAEEQKGVGLYHSALWTTFLTLVLGCVSISYCENCFQGCKWKDSMKVTMGIYAITKSIIVCLRITIGIGKPSVVIWGLNHLCECIILCHCVDRKYLVTLKEGVVGSLIYVSAIITICLQIPDTIIALSIEITFVLALDIALAVMFTNKYFFGGEDKKGDNLYLLPFLAHSIHLLFTMFPIIFSLIWCRSDAFFVKFCLETMINFSVPLTCILDVIWAFIIDEKMVSSNLDTIKDRLFLKAENKENNKLNSPEQNETRGLPTENSIKQVRRTLVYSFFASWIPLYIILYLMGPCPEDNFCSISKEVHQTTMYNILPGLEGALNDMLAAKDIESAAKKFNGNIDFVISTNMNKGVLQVFDAWSSIDFAKEWMNSEDAKLLSSKEVLQITNGNVTRSGYLSKAVLTPGCRPLEERSFVFSSNQSCNRLWKQLGDKNGCDFIPRCSHVSSNNDAFDLDIFTFYDGRVVKGNRYFGISGDKSILYDFSRSDDKILRGFKSDVTLESTGRNKCSGKVKMTIPREKKGNQNKLGPITEELRYIDCSNILN